MVATAQKLTVRERNKLRLRHDLLETVLDLFNDGDFAALNVENIARHTGCAKATVYVYFPGGRDEMLCAIYDEISTEVNAEAERLRAKATSIHGRIMGLAEALLTLAARPRRGKFFAQLNPMLSPVLQPVLGQSSQHYHVMLSTDLSQITDNDTTALVTLLVGAFREAAVKIAESPEMKPALLNAVSVLAASLINTLGTGAGKEL